VLVVAAFVLWLAYKALALADAVLFRAQTALPLLPLLPLLPPLAPTPPPSLLDLPRVSPSLPREAGVGPSARRADGGGPWILL
jgi:hypothetical protein